MSRTGVPLNASRPLTSRTLFFLFSNFTAAKPMQLGRMGDLVLKTPLRGRFGSHLGCTLKGNGMPESLCVQKITIMCVKSSIFSSASSSSGLIMIFATTSFGL